MSLKEDREAVAPKDWPKWLLVFILLLAGLFVNYYYSDTSMTYRTLAWLTLISSAGFVASKTAKGRWSIAFIKNARMELRKVVWPTKDEVMQTTLVVAVMVMILSLLLWGMDGVLVWLIGWMTGQHQ